MNSLTKAAALILLAACAMAQTLPRPTGPYMEPIPAWQAKAGIESQVVIAPGDDILPQIANSGTPDSVGFYTMFQAVNVGTATGDVPGELLRLGRGPHGDAPGDSQ